MRSRLSILLFGSGCHAVYAPNMPNAPLLSQRGELRASVDPRNLQVAYALTDHIGVVANGYYRRETDEHDEDPDERGQGHLLELGAGWSTPVPAVHPWLRAEVYAGAGVGAVEFDTEAGAESPARHFEADGYRAFVMPTVGVTRAYFDVALSARVVWLEYADVVSSNYDDVFAGVDEQSWFFLEPCLTVRVGYKWVKLQGQLGRSIELTGGDLEYDEGLTTLGLHIDVWRAFE